MPRPPVQPDRSTIAPAELDDYDSVVARLTAMGRTGGSAGPYHGPLLTSPPLAAVITRFGGLVRTRGEQPGSYTHAEREIVDMVLSRDLGYNGVLSVHIPDALALGVRLEAIEAILEGRDDDLHDDERQLVDFVRAVAGGTVTDAAWAAMEERMGHRGALEYAIFVNFLVFTIRMFQTMGIPAPDDGEIRQLLDEFRDGTRTIGGPLDDLGIPDYRSRLR